MRRLFPVMNSLGRAWRLASGAARRRPGAALVASAELALALTMIPDLFYAIPWPTRKAAGWVVVAGVAVACVGRLWQVRPGDDAPPPDEARPARWAGLAPPLACAALAVPLLRNPGNLGAGDWDVFLQKYEAIRRTILDHGQFPWWDPWCRGGFPLAGNPQCGVIGVATPMVLAFGASVGLRLAAIACVLIATEGARRLARLWLGDPIAALAAGLIYGINGGVLVQMVAGYHMPMSYCACPWMLYHAARLDRRRADGVLLGVWLAFDVLNGIQYYSVYAALILAVVWLRAVRARQGPARSRHLAHTAIAVGTLLALAGWRLATTGLVYRDFPRAHATHFDESPRAVLVHLMARPSAGVLERETGIHLWDTTCYIGPVVFVLALASLERGWRWWHTLASACGALAVGSVATYHPSYWLAQGPLLSSMHMVGRWRIMAMLGVGLAAADVLARWRLGPSAARRRLAVALVAIVAVDYVALGFELLPSAFRVAPGEGPFPGEPPPPAVVQAGRGMAFPAVLRGYGMVVMPEPLLGYDQAAATARAWRGQPDYVGEAWTDAGPVEPRSWSPNRIEFDVEPGQTVNVNQNPGSWWTINGAPAFPGWRCAETGRAFAARADARGRLVLEIRPRGLELGLALHLIGLATAGSAFLGARALRPAGQTPRTS